MDMGMRPMLVEQPRILEIRIALVMANSIDCEILSNLLSNDPQLEVVLSVSNQEHGFARLRDLHVQVLIIDPKCEPDAVSRTIELVLAGHVQRVILLDDKVREGLVAAILPFSQISYITRLAGSRILIQAIHQVVGGERFFGPALDGRIQRTARGWRLQQTTDQPSVASLTSRELQVVKLLATGRSVRDCAEHLQLSESTVDNHKTRLMKKLQIHKLAELTHLAIRDGLISV